MFILYGFNFVEHFDNVKYLKQNRILDILFHNWQKNIESIQLNNS